MIEETNWSRTEFQDGRRRAIGVLKVTHMICKVNGCHERATHVVHWRRARGWWGSERCHAHAKRHAESCSPPLVCPPPWTTAESAVAKNDQP